MADKGFAPSDIMANATDAPTRAHVDVDGAYLMRLDAEAVELTWKPFECPTQFLPVCAFNYSVTLFEDIWSEYTKRAWIDQSWSFLRQVGTTPAFETALKPSGYTLAQVVRPPQGFFASPDLTREEMDAWLALMPEIRVTFAERTGQDNGQWFANEGFAGDDLTGFAGYDDGALLRGRYAVLRRNGVDTPLHTLTETKAVEQQSATDFERYAIPGLSTLGFFANESAANDDRYVGSEEIPASIVTMRIDRTFDYERSRLDLNTLDLGLEPIDVRQKVTSDIGDAGLDIFAGDCFANVNFVYPDRSELMLASSVYLYDPSVATPMTAGVSFANVDRVGMPLRTIELMVDLDTYHPMPGCFAGETSVDDCYAVPEDTSHIDRAIRAIEASRGHLDRVLVAFDVRRPLQVQDTVDEGTRVGDWVKNSL